MALVPYRVVSLSGDGVDSLAGEDVGSWRFQYLILTDNSSGVDGAVAINISQTAFCLPGGKIYTSLSGESSFYSDIYLGSSLAREETLTSTFRNGGCTDE